ncbi:hypothetical protein CL658_00885 [bacterium]|nr:hypothetical protein [bacterium]
MIMSLVSIRLGPKDILGPGPESIRTGESPMYPEVMAQKSLRHLGVGSFDDSTDNSTWGQFVNIEALNKTND